jgi:hypothetical protein
VSFRSKRLLQLEREDYHLQKKAPGEGLVRTKEAKRGAGDEPAGDNPLTDKVSSKEQQEQQGQWWKSKTSQVTSAVRGRMQRTASLTSMPASMKRFKERALAKRRDKVDR